MTRISLEAIFMKTAQLFADRSTCKRARVGAVIVKNNRIISTGYVGSPPGLDHCLTDDCIIDKNTGGCIRTIHAEMNAIAWAAREGLNIYKSTLYTTLSPCLDCSKIIISAGIQAVVYLTLYRDQQGLDLLKSAEISLKQYREYK